MQVSSTLYDVGNSASSYLKGVKCALSVLGICSEFLVEPFKSFGPKQRKIITEAVEKIQETEFEKNVFNEDNTAKIKFMRKSTVFILSVSVVCAYLLICFAPREKKKEIKMVEITKQGKKIVLYQL